jgi:hypothetical protein
MVIMLDSQPQHILFRGRLPQNDASSAISRASNEPQNRSG